MDLNTLSSQGNKYSHISNDLLQFTTDSTIENNSSNIDYISSNLLIVDNFNHKVAVEITAKDIDALLPFLDNLEFEIFASAPEHHLVEGYIAFEALSQLEALAEEGLLMGVLPVYKPITNVGLIDSQADFVLEADRVKEALPIGYDGTGQTIAVFSDSYNISGNGSAATDIASGDLPAGVNVLQEFTGPGIDEGRAMLQLVHDLAPGADLVFSSFFFGQANAAQQIRDAANPAIGNADVLVDDISFLTSPFFQDGIVAQAVDEVVTNEGVTYFSSAGNSSDNSYESVSINFTPDSGGAFSNSFYDFDLTAGVDSRQEIVLDADDTFLATLQWDDPFYTANGVDTDLLFGLVDSSNNIFAVVDQDNIANQTPYEFLSYTNTTGSTQTLEVVITKEAGPDPSRIKYINFRDHNPTEYDTNSSTVFGHTAATNAQAVAAIPFFDQDTPEFFTSEGPTTILFEPDGTPKVVPEVRNTPDITAIDGTNTTFFGLDSITDSDSFPNFFGTSAAAPHAAAVAALVQQANPSFTPQQVYNRLQSTAEDIAPSGFDNVTGFGLINAYDAIFGLAVPATLPFVENFDDGDLPLSFETDTNGAGRIQVTSDFSPLGAQQLTLDSSGQGFDSLNEVILHVDTTGFTDVTLSFEQKEFGDEDNAMSANFIGSENSDGVALSVDGTNWIRLVDLTGANSTSSFQTNVVDLSATAAANGLTLGSGVQIKFQQFDNFPLTTDGFAFDNISVTGMVENTAPTITSGATASVPENQTSAIDVQTIDDIDSEGSGLTYSISGGADASAFSINAETGVVTFNAAPDFENPIDDDGNNVYEVAVTVTDSTNLTDTQLINVTVSDVNETPGGTTIEIEAEDIANVTGYRIENKSIASGGSMLSLIGQGGGEMGTATFNFAGASANYNVIIGTFDEDDGNASIDLIQGQTTIGTVLLDQNPGGNAPSANTKVEKTAASGVFINNGDSLTIKGNEDGDEHARFDYIRFEPAGSVMSDNPVISTSDSVTVPENQTGVSDLLRIQDEDLVRYNPSSGDLSLYFDGSDVGLRNRTEDLNAVSISDDELLLSTTGNFRVNALSGKNEDVFAFMDTTLGGNTLGSFGSDLLLDGSQSGFNGNVNGFDIEIG